MSPDSIVEAVLVETNAGATTSIGYNLYIVPTGAYFKDGHELFTVDYVANLDIIGKNIGF